MVLRVECPRCAAPLAPTDTVTGPGGSAGRDAGWACAEHGPVTPLRRPNLASYDDLVEHQRFARDLPTLLPWPLSPRWQLSDFAVVSPDRPGPAQATLVCVSGTSALDGPVDVLVVCEEPGTGLGARVAGVAWPDVDVSEPAAVRVRVEQQAVPLWPVSTSASDADWDRSVVAGESGGRWLWMVVRPAAAVLLLRDDWILRDVSGLGAPLVELAIGGPAPQW